MPGQLDSLQGVATNLITGFGKAATLTTVSKTFSATTGKVTESTSATTVYATPPMPFTKYRVDGESIRTTDLSTMVKGKDLSPKQGDRLTFAGIDYLIVEVLPQYCGTVVAFYELQLRA